MVTGYLMVILPQVVSTHLTAILPQILGQLAPCLIRFTLSI